MKRRLKNCVSEDSSQTEASKLINLFMSHFNHSFNYLEIGIHRGLTLQAVSGYRKVGVDPNPLCWIFPNKRVKIYKLTSDEYFAKFTDQKFDFIFLDGLHHANQTYKDLMNSFLVLFSQGFVLIDDVVPSDPVSSIIPQSESYEQRRRLGIQVDGTWHGDIFRIINHLEIYFSELLEWVTIESESNCRTLLWKKPEVSLESIYSQFIATEHLLPITTYEDTFFEGIPNYFRVIREDQMCSLAQRITTDKRARN